jgi:hypothetical protein
LIPVVNEFDVLSALEVHMRGISGLLLISIGVVHTMVGIFNGYSVLSQISRATFSTEATRQLVAALGKQFVFWFLLGGLLILVLGHLLTWIERRLGQRVPLFIGLELLALSVAGLLVMPVSGFWLVLAVAIYTIVIAYRSRTASGTAT